MTRTHLILIATLGSVALLLGAYGFQHLGGLAPCKMCLWQRWPGPTSCTGSGMDLGSMTGGDLLSLDGPLGVVMCDEIVWQFLGLSMAGWNAVISFALVLIWVAAARRSA